MTTRFLLRRREVLGKALDCGWRELLFHLQPGVREDEEYRAGGIALGASHEACRQLGSQLELEVMHGRRSIGKHAAAVSLGRNRRPQHTERDMSFEPHELI